MFAMVYVYSNTVSPSLEFKEVHTTGKKTTQNNLELYSKNCSQTCSGVSSKETGDLILTKLPPPPLSRRAAKFILSHEVTNKGREIFSKVTYTDERKNRLKMLAQH